MTNIVAVLIVRCTHTGVYKDGRPNAGSVTLYDLDEITIQKNRTRTVPIPPGTFVDIPMSTRTLVSYHNGAICKHVKNGEITAEVILQLRDKGNAGGPAGTGQQLRPAVLNAERVNNELRFVIPDNVIPTNLDSVGFMVGEPVQITGLTGAFYGLDAEYVISDAVTGDGLAGAQAGSYLVVVPSEGPDILAATLSGVNLALSADCGGGRVVAQFNSGGDVGGFGGNVYGYIGGQFFPNAGGGGGAPVDATYVTMTPNATLTQERILTAGTGITIVDGGANNPVTILALGIETFTAAQALAIGDLIALDAAGQAILANSSIAGGNWEVVGVATNAVPPGGTVQAITHGGSAVGVTFTVPPPAALNGQTAFLSATNGRATMTPPTTPGNSVFQVGVLQGADGVSPTPTVVFRPHFTALRR